MTERSLVQVDASGARRLDASRAGWKGLIVLASTYLPELPSGEYGKA